MDHQLLMKYKTFEQKWKHCNACSLHEKRYRTVLHRGSLDPDLLFIGEAPGDSEDIIGKPFVGPSGHYLNQLMEHVTQTHPVEFAITNVVCCFPGRTSSGDFIKPTKEQCLACTPRLLDYLEMTQPTLIVTLGQISKSRLQEPIHKYPLKSLPHPSNILRMPPARKEIEFRRHYHRLIDWIERYVYKTSTLQGAQPD